MAQNVMSSDSLCERLNVLEKLLWYLQEHFDEAESRKRNRDPVEEMAEVECPRNSLEWNEEGFDARKKRRVASEAEEVILERRNSLNDVETENFELLGVAPTILPRGCKTLGEIECREQSLRRAHESLAARERKVDEIIRALDGRIIAVEEREKEFNSFLEEKTREFVLKEEELLLKLEDEKLRRQQKLKGIDETVERLKSAENKLEGMRENLERRLEKIECRENVAWESAALRAKEGELIRGSIEKQLEELEKRRSELNSFQEEKMRELESKEQLLNEINEKAVKDAKLRSEKLIVRERSICQQLEDFEKTKGEFNSFREKKMGELESKEQLFNELSEKVAKDTKLRNEKLIMQERSINQQFEEFEKIKSEFNSFQEKKMGDLYSKEQLLNAMSEKVAKDAKLRNQELITRERSINQLWKRLNLAKEDVEGLKDVVEKRYKVLVSKENDVNSTRDWVERRMDEADSKAKKLNVKKKSISSMEDKVICKKYELMEKEKKLDLTEQALQAWQNRLEVKQKEVDSAEELNERRVEKLDAREKSMSELTGKCFKEHQAKKKELLHAKDLVEKVARFLGLENENLKNAIRELGFMEKQMSGHVVEHEPCSDKSNGHVRKELDEPVDLKFTVRMDGKNLQMFLNDPKKDLVSMVDEIFKVLYLSSDPAKLVLDAMVGFYPPHLREEDTAHDVRRTCIVLLKQLMKMTRIIKPCVREEAMQVALAWKSKMAENPSTLEALGFLCLLKAYDIASSFDKYQVSSLLKMVSLHREENPDLDRLLGFVDTLTGTFSLSYNMLC